MHRAHHPANNSRLSLIIPSLFIPMLLVTTIDLPIAAVADEPPAESVPLDDSSADNIGGPSTDHIDDPLADNIDWGLAFAAIPEVLRAHCPALLGGHGLLVSDVLEDSPAERVGIRTHDVLLELAGRPLTRSDELSEPDRLVPLLILRGGHVQMLTMRGEHPGRDGWFGPRFPRFPRSAPFGPQAAPRPFGPPVAANSVARASSSDNGSMSLSVVGDQIALEFSSSATGGKPVRLRGTIEQIERQVQERELSPEAQQQVWDALREIR